MCALAVGLLSLVVIFPIDRILAQAQYNIFPAQHSSSALTTKQPTRRSRVTLAVQDSTIEYVVNEIARQAKLQPVYNGGDTIFARRITVRLTNATVMEAFVAALKGTALVAQQTSGGETVVIRPKSSSAAPHDQTVGGIVTGRVVDSTSGAGVGGATIRVVGTKLSIISSDSGYFTVHDVPVGEQILSVRLFGYRRVDRTIIVDSTRTAVRIVLASVPTAISGVVTTATGLQRKVEVGNDITTLNVDSVMKVAPVMNVTDLLETRVPGLTVLHSSGLPGAPARLRLRGVGSVELNNDPIVIVDGIRVYASQSDARNDNLAKSSSPQSNPKLTGSYPQYSAPSPLDQIDPASIETIEVFKGPSATAIYGSDAANGVIVITTKRGRAGPTHWTVALKQGINWLPGNWPVNYYRFGTGDNNGVNNLSAPDYVPSQYFCYWLDPSCHVDSVVPFQALNDSRYTVFTHGTDQVANLNISGGVPTIQYTLAGGTQNSLGNLKLPGIEQTRYANAYGSVPQWMIRPDKYQTWSIAGSLNLQPAQHVQIKANSSLFNGNQQQGSLNGAIVQLEGMYINPSLFALSTTPLIVSDVERATSASLTATNVLALNWQPTPWLPVTATAGLNTQQRTDETYIPYGVSREGIGQVTHANGSYGLGRGTSHNQTVTIGSEVPLFAQRVKVAVGGNLYSQSTADFAASVDSLSPGVSAPTNFPTDNQHSAFSQSTTDQSTYGWYIEPRLNMASRFFVSPGFRFDGGSGGSSTTANGISGLTTFPKINLSYVAVDRPGQPLWGIVTQLRPRLSFGYAGTQPLPQSKLRLLNAGQYNPVTPGLGSLGGLAGALSNSCSAGLSLDGGATYVPPVCLSSLGNTQLAPERSSELESGFDATLWQGRLSLTYTQFNKTRHDAIITIPVAPSVISFSEVGSAVYEKNVGDIRNTGTELTINAIVFQHRAFSWNVNMNLSNDNNVVVRLNPGQTPFCLSGGNLQAGGSCIVPGYPLFGEWVQPIVAFYDANHNGVIEASEVRLGDSAVYAGQPNPKYQWNLSSDVSLFNGRLSLHATFAYQNGMTQDNAAANGSGAFLALANAPNTSLATQAAIIADCGNEGISNIIACPSNFRSSSGLIQTVSTFRFQDLSINYEVPKTVAALMRVPRMTLILQGSNLGLHSNYRGKDPAVNAFSTAALGDLATDTGQIPMPRVWQLQVNVGN